MIWTPNLEKQKNSRSGRYIAKYMTPTIEAVRLLTLVPIAWGAWIHDSRLVLLGLSIPLVGLVQWVNVAAISINRFKPECRRLTT